MYVERIGDPLQIPGRLNQMAREFKRQGYVVKRGMLGTIILVLRDGKVIYAPAGGGIVQTIINSKGEAVV